MFDIGWSELLVIGVVALIAIGPKELPGVLRMVGQWMGKVRRMASEFQGQFQEAMREAEMADIKKQVDDITNTRVDRDQLRSARRHQQAVRDRDRGQAGADHDARRACGRDAVRARAESRTQDNATVQPASSAPAEPEAAPQPKVGSGA